MDLVQSSPIPESGVIFIRLVVRYGYHLFHWNERKLSELFAFLQATVGSIIFQHNEDCCISKEKPKPRPEHLKDMLKQENSVNNPLIFEGQFSLDCDQNGAGPRAEFRTPGTLRSSMHKLSVDAVFSLSIEKLSENIFEPLQAAVIAHLTDYESTLLWFLAAEKSLPRSLTAYYFIHGKLLIRIFYPPAHNKEAQWRVEIHRGKLDNLVKF